MQRFRISAAVAILLLTTAGLALAAPPPNFSFVVHNSSSKSFSNARFWCNWKWNSMSGALNCPAGSGGGFSVGPNSTNQCNLDYSIEQKAIQDNSFSWRVDGQDKQLSYGNWDRWPTYEYDFGSYWVKVWWDNYNAHIQFRNK